MLVNSTLQNQLGTPIPGQQKAAKKETQKDMFMKLFVAQLKNQDPLKPMSDKDSAAQLAQFSQLEQMANMTKMMEGVVSSIKQSLTVQASTFIGKSVLAAGNTVAKNGDDVSGVNLDIPKGMASVRINIHDSAGNIIKTVEMKDPQPGKKDFKWDGTDHSGKSMGDGQYKISVVAEDKSGKKYLIETKVEGKVKGVEVVKGEAMLVLENGTQVALKNVWRVNGSEKKEA